MRTIPLTPAFFQGAASVERQGNALLPWRIPHERSQLFPSPDDGLLTYARYASGVRLRIRTESPVLQLAVAPTPVAFPVNPLFLPVRYDLVIDNEIVETMTCEEEEQTICFTGLPGKMTTCEIWLPPQKVVCLKSLTVKSGTSCKPAPDKRARWIVYGSSITHCVRAASPARTWPAIFARSMDLNLISLGLGGQCHLDPMVAGLIRDLPAAAITLKLGANPCYAGSLNLRTYAPAVIGTIMTIRDKHPQTPILLISPIASCGYEEKRPHPMAMTLPEFRDETRGAYHRLKSATGDPHLFFMDGLRMLSVAEMEGNTPDGIHPNATGIEQQASNFLKRLPAGFRRAIKEAGAARDST